MPRILFLWIVCSLWDLGSSTALASSKREPTLTILASGPWFDIPRLAALCDSLRREGQPLLVVHEVDIPGNSVASARSYVSLLQDAGVDVALPTSMNFRMGPDALVDVFRRFSGARPVCANLQDTRGNLLFPPYLILNKGGLKIGLIAVRDSSSAFWRFREGDLEAGQVSISDPQAAVRSALSSLRNKVDLVILFTSESYKPRISALQSIPGIDLLLTPREVWAAGHTTSRYPGSQFINLIEMPFKRRAGRFPVVQAVSLKGGNRDSIWAERMRKFREENDQALDIPYELKSMGVGDEIDERPDSIALREEKRLSRLGATRARQVTSRPGKNLGAALVQGRYGSISLRWQYPFSDTLPRAPYSLYWRPARLVQASISRDPCFPEIWHGSVAAGSQREIELLRAIRSAADRYFSWEEQDSLERQVDITQPEPLLRQTLAPFSPAEDRVLCLLGLARFLEAQATSGLTETPRYWHRRGIVYADLECDAKGKILDAALLENNAWPSAGDSVLALVRGWPIPSQGHEARPDLTWSQIIAVPVDRREGRLRLGDTVPGDLRSKFEQNPLAAWFKNLIACDPTIALDDFIDVGAETLRTNPGRKVLAGDLRTRDRFGVLLSSPKGRWSADPFPGGTLTDKGSIELSKNSGVRLFEGKSRDKVREWQAPDQEIDLAIWLDASRLVLAGWSSIDHPRISGKWVQFSVPTLWILDLGAQTSRRFQGPPLSPKAFQQARAGRRSTQEAAFPLLTWGR